MELQQPNKQSVVRVTLEVPLEPTAAFDQMLAELNDALAMAGIEFKPGPTGKLIEHGFEVGGVSAWKPGEQVLLRWRSADWLPEQFAKVEMRFKKLDGATLVEIEHRGLERLVTEPAEIAGWFASEVATPFLRALSPAKFGDWFTDRRARRPSGASARAIYGDPIFHYPNFRAILEELALTNVDYLLEVGCGGGALLKLALASGCRAAAIDHSIDMIRLARETNSAAIAEGRLMLHHTSAEHLPFDAGTFSCAVLTGVLGFLPDPIAALREIHRVLRPNGRFVALGADPKMKGTPAAPEPMASRLRFYKDDELELLARNSGFQDARVVLRDLGKFARESGVPAFALPLFEGQGTPFLIARKT